MDREQLINKIRHERDEAAARGDHAEALILNDRVRDLKEGGLLVERAMQVFESGLARRRAYYWCRADLTCGCGACDDEQ
jgi:hypothetical protein